MDSVSERKSPGSSTAWTIAGDSGDGKNRVWSLALGRCLLSQREPSGLRLDGDPYILDTDLAKALGMAKTRDIRSDLIKPNLEEF
jgi:hypothetical protein